MVVHSRVLPRLTKYIQSIINSGKMTVEKAKKKQCYVLPDIILVYFSCGFTVSVFIGAPSKL